ncbi:hypothetical protein KO465_01250 [Candidatus Micrarchaeota archaeon]|nr:hypothetical protein [Candidatus Micrarchaeota archaeon]
MNQGPLVLTEKDKTQLDAAQKRIQNIQSEILQRAQQRASETTQFSNREIQTGPGKYATPKGRISTEDALKSIKDVFSDLGMTEKQFNQLRDDLNLMSKYLGDKNESLNNMIKGMIDPSVNYQSSMLEIDLDIRLAADLGRVLEDSHVIFQTPNITLEELFSRESLETPINPLPDGINPNIFNPQSAESSSIPEHTTDTVLVGSVQASLDVLTGSNFSRLIDETLPSNLERIYQTKQVVQNSHKRNPEDVDFILKAISEAHESFDGFQKNRSKILNLLKESCSHSLDLDIREAANLSEAEFIVFFQNEVIPRTTDPDIKDFYERSLSWLNKNGYENYMDMREQVLSTSLSVLNNLVTDFNTALQSGADQKELRSLAGDIVKTYRQTGFFVLNEGRYSDNHILDKILGTEVLDPAVRDPRYVSWINDPKISSDENSQLLQNKDLLEAINKSWTDLKIYEKVNGKNTGSFSEFFQKDVSNLGVIEDLNSLSSSVGILVDPSSEIFSIDPSFLEGMPVPIQTTLINITKEFDIKTENLTDTEYLALQNFYSGVSNIVIVGYELHPEMDSTEFTRNFLTSSEFRQNIKKEIDSVFNLARNPATGQIDTNCFEYELAITLGIVNMAAIEMVTASQSLSENFSNFSISLEDAMTSPIKDYISRFSGKQYQSSVIESFSLSNNSLLKFVENKYGLDKVEATKYVANHPQEAIKMLEEEYAQRIETVSKIENSTFHMSGEHEFASDETLKNQIERTMKNFENFERDIEVIRKLGITHSLAGNIDAVLYNYNQTGVINFTEFSQLSFSPVVHRFNQGNYKEGSANFARMAIEYEKNAAITAAAATVAITVVSMGAGAAVAPSAFGTFAATAGGKSLIAAGFSAYCAAAEMTVNSMDGNLTKEEIFVSVLGGASGGSSKWVKLLSDSSDWINIGLSLGMTSQQVFESNDRLMLIDSTRNTIYEQPHHSYFSTSPLSFYSDFGQSLNQ